MNSTYNKISKPWSIDPTEDTLSPYIWLPLVLITVLCFLFISIRRTQSIQYYYSTLN